jgi:hypothetical protein
MASLAIHGAVSELGKALATDYSIEDFVPAFISRVPVAGLAQSFRQIFSGRVWLAGFLGSLPLKI